MANQFVEGWENRTSERQRIGLELARRNLLDKRITQFSGHFMLGGYRSWFEMLALEDSIQAHHARNRELLKLIASKGADPNVPRDIDLHFWASNEDAARNLCAELESRGYSPVAMKRAAADASVWNVETRVHATPLSVAVPGFVEDLVRIAADNDSEFDGWGTSI